MQAGWAVADSDGVFAFDGVGEFGESAVFLGHDEPARGRGGGHRSVLSVGAQTTACRSRFWFRRGDGLLGGGDGDTFVDLTAEPASVGAAGGVDVFEGDGVADMVGVDRFT